MPSDIILIGPVRTGKTTVGQLLAERLGLPHVALDDLRWNYYKEIGYNQDLAQQIRQTGGFVALVFYWKLFDAYAVERVLADHRDCVIDFGAGHSVYENRELFVRHRSNYDLARFIVYTQGKAPEETCDEILSLIGR